MSRRAGGAVNRRGAGAVSRRAGAGRSPEPTEVPDTEISWDDVVDVICVGTDPGPVAHALSGVHRDRRVLVVARPDTWDADTAGYIAEMTAELPTPPPGPAVAFTRPRVIDVPFTRPLDAPITRPRVIDAPAVRGRPIDTFEGARLRDWAAQCWASPLGVLYTDVVDETLVHTDEGRCFEGVVIGSYSSDCALEEWLAVQAGADGVRPDPDVTWRRAILEYGRVAGVELDTASGPVRVRTLDGVALPTVPGGGDPAPQPDLPGGAGAVAIVGFPVGRFGRVQLLFPD